MDKDQLAALDRDAREAENIIYRMQCEAFLGRALINAYRTGKLVLIDDGAVERAVAGMMLVPEGFLFSLSPGVNGTWLLETEDEEMRFFTPAEALLAALEKART